MMLSFRLLPQYYELVKSGKKYMEFRSITDYYVKKLMGGVAFGSEEELQKFVGEATNQNDIIIFCAIFQIIINCCFGVFYKIVIFNNSVWTNIMKLDIVFLKPIFNFLF